MAISDAAPQTVSKHITVSQRCTRWMFAGLCASAALAAAGPVAASAAEPFYKGKQLTVLINFAPGGPTDIEGRLFAKHLAKHIDGRPNLLVQNMPGAGGMIGTNHLGKIAPKDGTVLGYLTGSAWQAVIDSERFAVDYRTYEFVAYEPGTTVYFMRTDIPPGMKEPADIGKADGLVAGGLTAASTKDLRIRMTLDMLGVPYKYATGYGSNQPARLAFERGEINFFAESPPAYRSVVKPNLVDKGVAIAAFYDTGYNGADFIVPKQVEGLPILPFQELYKKVKGTMPSGPLWEAYLSVISVNAAMQRMVVLPPNAPEEAVTALRTAVRRLNEDKEFAQEAEKAIGFAPDYEAGPDTNRQVRRALAIQPESKAFISNYMQEARR